MADDPNRDLLPVKDMCRQICGPQKLKPTNTMSIPSYSTFGEDSKDLQQRHYVTKLDRDELEDRFLRLIEDHMHMKKKCNSQEEKIKRLATKLLRIVSDRDRALKSASERRDHHAIERVDEMQARIKDLELGNQQLQERIVVLKTQLGTHSKLHASVHYNSLLQPQSPSRCGSKSRPDSRTGMCSEDNVTGRKGFDTDQYGGLKNTTEEESLRRRVKQLEQEMAAMQEQNRVKIVQLENQLAYLTAEDQRSRAAENVEMIRLKRDLKTQSMQMEAVKAQAQDSELELERIQDELRGCQANNCCLSQELNLVKSSNLDLVVQLTDARGSSQNSQDLRNQVSDLKREQKSLKSQNSQLLEIASKTICSDNIVCGCSDEGNLDGYNNSGAMGGAAPEDQADLTAMYGEMQKIRELSSPECYNSECNDYDDNELNAMGADRSKSSKYAENNKGKNKNGRNVGESPSESAMINENDSHYRAHNRLCTCEKQERKSYFPPCSCGCSLCSQNQLSKKDFGEKNRGMNSRQRYKDDLLTPLPAGVSEQYVRQEDLASSSNAGSTTSAGEQQGSKSPASEYGSKSGSYRGIGSVAGSSSLTGQQLGHTSSVGQCGPGSSSSGRMENILEQQGSKTPVGPYGSQGGSRRAIMAGHSASSGQQQGSEPIEVPCGNECNSCGGSRMEGIAGPSTLAGRQQSSKPALSQYSSHSSDSNRGKIIAGSSGLPGPQPGSTTSAGPCGGASCSSGRMESIPGPTSLSTQQQQGYGSSANKSVTSPTRGQLGLESGSLTNSGQAIAISTEQVDMLHELEVCKELLRVQCSLNATFKRELTKLYEEIAKLEGSASSGSTSETTGSTGSGSTGGSAASVNNPQKVSPRVSPMPPDSSRRKSLLRVGDGEGLFEIHAHCIELTEEGTSHIPPECSMYMTWTFYDQEVAHTPLKKGPKAEINTSAVYRVNVDENFLEHLAHGECRIELHASKDDSTEMVGQGALKFSEILDFPQNKLFSSVRLLSLKPCEPGRTLAMFQCWFRLSCELTLISEFNKGRTPSPKSQQSPNRSDTDSLTASEKKPQSQKSSKMSDLISIAASMKSGTKPMQSENSIAQEVSAKLTNSLLATKSGVGPAGLRGDLGSLEISGSNEEDRSARSNSDEYASGKSNSMGGSNSQDGSVSGGLISKNSAKSAPPATNAASTKSDIPAIRPRAKSIVSSDSGIKQLEMMEELGNKWEEVVNDFDDISITRERELKADTAKKISLHNLSSQSTNSSLDEAIDNPLVLNIEIHNILPDLSGDFYKKANVVQLYIEYKFLGFSGPELETKSVKLENKTLVFNYKKSFNYSAADQLKMLADTYTSNEWHVNSLQFVAVSEPSEAESSVQDCEEVGFAEIDLKKLMHKREDLLKSELPILGADGNSTKIGTLTVSITGVNTCRKAIRNYLKTPTLKTDA